MMTDVFTVLPVLLLTFLVSLIEIDEKERTPEPLYLKHISSSLIAYHTFLANTGDNGV